MSNDDRPARNLRLDDLSGALQRLVAGVGSPLVDLREVTASPADGRRRCYRLHFEDGRIFKGRTFASSERAHSTWSLLTTLRSSFLRQPLAHDADAWLEEWVDGEIVADLPSDRVRADTAGHALGTLHAHALPPGTYGVQPRPAASWIQKTLASLADLQELALVAPAQALAMARQLEAECPTSTQIAIVHRDLCPENLIVDRSGELRSIDNGSVTVGAIDHDLARTWYRWRMTADERRAFFTGYRRATSRDVRDVPIRFWAIVVLLNSARVRVPLPGAAAAVLRALDDYLAESSPQG